MATKRLDETVRRRLRTGRMLLAGKTPAQAAHAVGVARQTVYTWQALLDEGGIDALRAMPTRGRPARLDDEQLQALARAMTVPEIVLAQVDSPALTAIACDLFREYADAIGHDLEYQGFAAELEALPQPYVPPNGALFIAHAASDVAGCVGLRPIDSLTGEMKRLYVRPAYRSIGLGKRLVDRVIHAARQAGYRELRLDTLPGMASAQALYHRLGFVEIPPYSNKYLPGTRFFGLRLTIQ